MSALPDDIELLTTLSRYDSVEATSTTDGDLGVTVGPWTELVLDLAEHGGRVRRLELTRHDAELVIQVLFTVLHPHTNRRGAVERMWALLDDQMDFLLADDEPEPEDKIRAKAIAECITICLDPLAEPGSIDVTEVREEAVARWEERP